MAKAVIYARFSCDKQRNESIEDQVRICRREAEGRGDTIVNVYADAAKSGRSDYRPKFLQMIADAQSKKTFERIYVYKLDRFARNRFHAVVYRKKLQDAGVDLVSAVEHVPDGPEGIIVEGLFEAIAEWYSAMTAQQVLRGMEGNALDLRTNGVRVYGFRTGADGRYEEDPDESPVVRRVFAEAAAGSTVSSIAERLNADGLRTRRGAPWGKSSVNRMIFNDKYLGLYKWGDVEVRNGMPRIVDEDTVLNARVACGTRMFSNETSYVYPLSGLLYTEAGESITGTFGTGKSGKRYHYYRCNATGRTWPQSALDEKVLGAITKAIRTPGFAAVAADLAMAGQAEVMADQINEMEALRKRAGSIGREYGMAIDLATKIGTDDAVIGKIEALRTEKAQVESRLAEMESSSGFIERDMVTYWIEKMLEEKNVTTLARSFITRITLTDDDLARVEFNANYQVDSGVCLSSNGAPFETSSKHRVPWFGAVLEALPGGFILEFPLRAAA